MAKAAQKQRNKKYVPKQVYYPGLMIQIHAFSEFEKALTNFLEHEQVDVDSEGTFTYKNAAGIVQSFAITLHVYTLLAYHYGQRHGISYDLQPLAVLQNRMYERRGFDEDEIVAARARLDICKQILNKANPAEVRDILLTIRMALKMDEVLEMDMTQPDIVLAKMATKFGNIGYDLVMERIKEYQQIVEDDPEDKRAQKLLDDYNKYAAAFRFKRIEEIRNKGLT